MIPWTGSFCMKPFDSVSLMNLLFGSFNACIPGRPHALPLRRTFNPLLVQSEVRQSCPLAPSLFLLAVELLGLAIRQDPGLCGLSVPGDDAVKHIFSAFVDDSTLFLQRAEQLEPSLRLITRFGELSGLHAQPTKSKLIFLNTSIQLEPFSGCVQCCL